MQKTLSTLQRSLWMVFLTLLVACGMVPPAPTITPTATSAPTRWVEPVETFTPAQPTATLAPTETHLPAPTILPPTPNSNQLAILDRLRTAYIKNGNLYVQDGINSPQQLTHSGQDRAPSISDDGEKIIFYRGKPYEINEVYSINADGSQEHALIVSSTLAALNLGYTDATELGTLVFVPGTHRVLFSTQEFQGNNAENRAIQNRDLLLVDTDTAKIKQLLKPGEMVRFGVSPNGKLAAIQSLDQIKIINLAGQVIRRALLTYPTSLGGYGVGLFWTQDSSQLFMLSPEQWNDDIFENPTPFIIWKCPLNGYPAVKIRLTPAPMGDDYAISPDGNWIVYSFYHHRYESEADGKASEGVYLGNLSDGNAKLIAERLQSFDYFQWSPDRTHFIFRQLIPPNYQQVLGNINGELTLLKDVQDVIGWVDASHYLFGNAEMGAIDTETTFSVAEFAGVSTSGSVGVSISIIKRER